MRIALFAVTVAVAAAGAAYLIDPAAVPGSTDGYERTTLTVVDDETGEMLAIVNVRVTDTRAKRFIGLNDTESFTENEGIRFAHDSSGTYIYVMRDMDFPLDIVFVAENGTITRVNHVELDPEGTSESGLTRYRGTGKYVLELFYGYTNEAGIDVGGRVEVEQKRNARRAGDR